MRPLAFLLGALAGSAATPRRHRSRAALDLERMQLPPASVPAAAVGAFTLGALAIGRLEIRKARLREVEIDSLTVRRFNVADGADESENGAEL